MALTTIPARGGDSVVRNVVALADKDGNVIPAHTLDTSRPTYRFAATFTPLATAALTVLQIKGSATKTVRVKRIQVMGVSTAAGSSNYVLQRVTATGTGGTAVTPTAALNDSNSPAATAVVTHYTSGAQSVGTAAGGPLSAFVLGTSIVTLPTTGPVEPFLVFPEYGAPIGQSLVLRGTGDMIEIQNKNAGNLPSGTVLSYMIELEEDAS